MIHNWEKKNYVFIVNLCSYSDRLIEKRVRHVANTFEKAVSFIKANKDEVHLLEFWWNITKHLMNENQDDSPLSVNVSKTGDVITSPPINPHTIRRDTHMTKCVRCRDKYVKIIASYFKIGETVMGGRYGPDLVCASIKPTGRVCNEGHEFHVDLTNRMVYVNEDGAISYNPSNRPRRIEVAEGEHL